MSSPISSFSSEDGKPPSKRPATASAVAAAGDPLRSSSALIASLLESILKDVRTGERDERVVRQIASLKELIDSSDALEREFGETIRDVAESVGLPVSSATSSLASLARAGPLPLLLELAPSAEDDTYCRAPTFTGFLPMRMDGASPDAAHWAPEDVLAFLAESRPGALHDAVSRARITVTEAQNALRGRPLLRRKLLNCESAILLSETMHVVQTLQTLLASVDADKHALLRPYEPYVAPAHSLARAFAVDAVVELFRQPSGSSGNGLPPKGSHLAEDYGVVALHCMVPSVMGDRLVGPAHRDALRTGRHKAEEDAMNVIRYLSTSEASRGEGDVNPIRVVRHRMMMHGMKLAVVTSFNYFVLMRMRDDGGVLVSSLFVATDPFPLCRGSTPTEEEKRKGLDISAWELILQFYLGSLGKSWVRTRLPPPLIEYFRGPASAESDAPSEDDAPISEPSSSASKSDAPISEMTPQEICNKFGGDAEWTRWRARRSARRLAPGEAFPDLCYFDLFAPARFDGKLPIDICLSSERLQGDALEIASSRTGKVYRQRLFNEDVALKVFEKHAADHYDRNEDRGIQEEIPRELDNEVRVYHALASFQNGSRTTKLRWRGHLQRDVIQALATDYVEGREPRTEDEARAALRLLSELHAHGVLHGNVSRRNFIVRSSDASLVVLDFGHAKLKTDEEFKGAKGAATWRAAVANEKAAAVRVFEAEYDSEQ